MIPMVFKSGGVVVVSSNYSILPCGCSFAGGIRLDSNEMCFIMYSCAQHEGAMTKTHSIVTTMEPSEEPMLELTLRIFGEILAT